MKPEILLINPWIYDFSAINLWSRPLGLLKVYEGYDWKELDIIKNSVKKYNSS